MKELIKDIVSIIKDMKEKDEDFTICNWITNFVLALAACSMIGTTVNIIVTMVQSVEGSFMMTIVMIAYACATFVVCGAYFVSVVVLLSDVALTVSKKQ